MIGHVLLVGALAALVSAGLRAAAALGATGAVRVVAAAPLAAAAAALSALVLGRAGLSGSAPALAALVLLAWVGARIALPAAAEPLRPVAAWRSLTSRERLALGATAGAGAAWVAWIVRHPGLGTDPLTYHLPESIAWVQNGDAGAVRQVVYEFPVGNYPLTDETLVSWLLGLAGTLGPVAFWAPAMAALGGFAGFTGLRLIGASRAVAALGVATILLVPIFAALYVGTHTDVGAVAWLACAGTLVAAARRRRSLLVPAILAAGLAVGTKTTTAPLIVVLALVALRPPLRPRAALLAAGAAAVAVGGVWYLRNLVEHGSPLWPFVAMPWGDPLPTILVGLDVAFMDRIGFSLDGRVDDYWRVLGASPLLIPAALAAAALTRRRPVVLAAAVTALATLVWARAPYTGRPDDPVIDLSLTTVRYLLPALCAAVVTLALAGGRAAAVVLGVTAALSGVQALELGYPDVPSAGVLAAGAVAGALAAAIAGARRIPLPLAPLAAAAGVVALTVSANGFTERHAQNPRLPSSPMIQWLAAQPGFHDGSAPIASAPQVFGVLAGDDLQHDIGLIGRTEPCERVLARRGWIVIGTPPFSKARARFTAGRCLAGQEPAYRDPQFRVYDRRQTATTSSTSSRPSSTRKKSSSVISAARGSSSRRARDSSRS